MTYSFARTDLPLLNYRPTHYLLSYDRDAKQVTVTPYDAAKRATLSYDEAEASNNRTDSNNQNIVLVEVEKIDILRRAYPNYFGGVSVFMERLKAVVHGASAISFLRSQPQHLRPDLTPGATHEICLACCGLTYDDAPSRLRGNRACRSRSWDGILARSKTRAAPGRLSIA